MSLEEIPVQLSRNAFNPAEVARAGDLWRLCQDAAVFGSARRGWPPERYRVEQCAFIVRSMCVVHHRPTPFGESLLARTWVSSFRRGTLSDRQIRIVGPDGLVASATQRWVHVSVPDLKPSRAHPALEAAFVVVRTDEADVALPSAAPAESPEHVFAFDAWYGWMDPLAHANHPAYVDWCDEATSRVLAAGGIDPHELVPVAEEVTWRSGVVAPERVTVTSRLVGTLDRATVIAHVLTGGDGRRCAEATTVRRLRSGEAFAPAFAGR